MKTTRLARRRRGRGRGCRRGEQTTENIPVTVSTRSRGVRVCVYCVSVHAAHRPSERTFRHSCQFLPIALLSFVFVSERDATPCSRIYARPAADRTNRHKHNRLTVTHYNPRKLRASVSARSECLTSLLAISVCYRYRRSRCVMKQPKNK